MRPIHFRSDLGYQLPLTRTLRRNQTYSIGQPSHWTAPLIWLQYHIHAAKAPLLPAIPAQTHLSQLATNKTSNRNVAPNSGFFEFTGVISFTVVVKDHLLIYTQTNRFGYSKNRPPP